MYFGPFLINVIINEVNKQVEIFYPALNLERWRGEITCKYAIAK